jgi:hypothetical protein
MADDRDVLVTLFKHNAEVGLHHQGQSSSTTKIVLTLASILIGLITFDRKITGFDHLAAYGLIGLGFFGLIWSAKHHERYDFFMTKAEAYRDKLATLVPELEITALEMATEKQIAEQSGLLHRLRVRYLWMSLNLVVIGVGLLIVVLHY